MPYLRLGTLYQDTDRYDKAIQNYKEAYRLNPENADAVQLLFVALNFVCAWSERNLIFNKLHETTFTAISKGEKPFLHPFNTIMLSMPSDEKLAVSRAWSDAEKQHALLTVEPDFPDFPFKYRLPKKGEKIRIGYVSSDFRNHPLGHLMMGVFGKHDRSRFHVVCFSLNSGDNSIFRLRIQEQSEEFYETSGHATAFALAKFIH